MVAADDQQGREGDTVRLDRVAPPATEPQPPVDDLQNMLEEVPARRKREQPSTEQAHDQFRRSPAHDPDPLNRVAPAPDTSFQPRSHSDRAPRQRRVRRYNFFLDELLPWVLIGLGLIPAIAGGWQAMTLAGERWAIVAIALAVVGCAFVFVQVPLSSIGMNLLARVRGIDLPDRVAFRVAAILLMLSGTSFLAQQAIGPAGAVAALVIWIPSSLLLVWLLFHLTWLEALLGWLISGVFAVVGALATVLLVAAVMFVVGLIAQPAGPQRRAPRIISPTPAAQTPPTRPHASQNAVGDDQQMRRASPAEDRTPTPTEPPLPALADLAVMVPTAELKPRVIAAMSEMARGDQPVTRRLEAIAVLERWSSEPTTRLWLELLGDDDPAMREAAIDRLSQTAEAEAIGPIIDLQARHPDRVAGAIERYGRSAEPALIQQIEQADPEAQTRLLALLDPIATPQAEPLLKELTHSADHAVAAAARRLILRIAPDRFNMIDHLLIDLASPDAQVQHRALDELAAMNVQADRRAELARAIEPLVVGAEASLHEPAARALGRWARPGSFEFLYQFIDQEDDDPARRKGAIIAMGYLGGERVVDPLIRWLLLEPQVTVEALEEVGEPAERPLIRLIRDDRAELATRACEILRQIGGLRAKVALESLLRRPGIDASVRTAAASALESIRQRLAESPDEQDG